MNGPTGFWLDLVGLAGPPRRAVDETLADWRHEASQAATLTRRISWPCADVSRSVALSRA